MPLLPDTFVRLKSDPTRAGILQPGEKLQANLRMVPVRFPDGLVSWLPEVALEAVPTAAPPLVERFAAGRFVDPGWLRRTLSRIRVTGRLSDVVYSMEATETDFYAYQFKPVLKLLNSPTDALLIADEVGLGKTIEAGLIWTELRARLESNRLLVLCPKTLCEKWRLELDRRFGVDARIVDASELLRLLSTSRSNARGFAAIASMQSLRPPRGWDEEDVDTNTAATPRLRLAHLLRDAAEEQPLIDLLVIDEAHHMRNPETLLYAMAELLNPTSSHRVFLSATPIHLRNRDLHSLLRLIDPDTFEYESTVDDLILANAPIVEARDLILKPTTTAIEILEQLRSAKQHELLQDSKALALLEEEMTTRHLDGGTRAEIASRLEQVNQLANYVTRTRRRDVEGFRVKRDPWVPVLEMHADERRFYEAITEAVARYAQERAANERFLLSMAQRLLTSSPAAASEYWSNHQSKDDSPIEETDRDLEPNGDDDRPLVARLCEIARDLGLSARLQEVDTKYRLLWSQLRQVWEKEPAAKIIIFSSFKPTLYYLERRLEADGIVTAMLHGSIKDPRDQILSRFKDDPNIRLLLSSEVGSEGVDLQFCWIVVNYDLPWNPMRLEQRIGRIDRLGQTKPKIIILNLIYGGTIDDWIYQKLYVRLGIGERALGEFEAVLGEPIREMTLKLLDPTLTEQEKNAAIVWAAQAVANLKHQEDKLEAEAGALVRHGDYILQKITEARELNRWLGEEDILVYVQDRLRRSFSGCSIDASPPGSQTYRITLSTDANHAFAGFLAKRGLKGTTRLIDGNDQQRYRFTSSVARASQGRVEYISQMHPLVRFAAELDRRDDRGKQAEPVAAILSRHGFDRECELGLYIIGVHRWHGNSANDRLTGMTRLAYAGMRVGDDILLPADFVEQLTGAAATRGRVLPNARADERLAEAAVLLRDKVLPDLGRQFTDFIHQVTAEVEDRMTIRQRALERHLENKSAQLTNLRDRHQSRAEGLVARGEQKEARRFESLALAAEGKLKRLRATCDLRMREIQEQREITPEESEVAALFVEISV